MTTIVTKNTQFTVRPDVVNTATINNFNNEEGVIVYDKETQKLMTNNGSGWSTLGVTSEQIAQDIQGYYGLLTDFYFGGSDTTTSIENDDVNEWVDVLIDVNSNGRFDNRPTQMVADNILGHTGDGSEGSPIQFSLEGLDISSSGSFRASMSFTPEADEGQVETRLLFTRHSGTTPSSNFSIEDTSLEMFQGADIPYTAEPYLSFFVGDTIDTNGVGDAGTCKFQIKANVEGVLNLRALTWYINK